MDFVPLLALGTLTYKLLDFLKYLRAGAWNDVTTQASAWVAGVVATFLVAQTEFAAGIQVGDVTLAELNGWSLLFFGLVATSLLSTVHDFSKAVNPNTSGVKPKLTRLR